MTFEEYQEKSRETAIYPNPVLEKLYVSTKEFDAHKVEYGIYDILGNEIAHQTLEAIDGVFEVKEVNSLSVGTYFIRIFSRGQDTFIQKFQKL